MKDKIYYYIGCYGERVGWGLIILVLLWDVAMRGVRAGLLHYTIGWKGVIVLCLGIALIRFSRLVERRWGR